jgi:hypothetical protein
MLALHHEPENQDCGGSSGSKYQQLIETGSDRNARRQHAQDNGKGQSRNHQRNERDAAPERIRELFVTGYSDRFRPVRHDYSNMPTGTLYRGPASTPRNCHTAQHPTILYFKQVNNHSVYPK